MVRLSIWLPTTRAMTSPARSGAPCTKRCRHPGNPPRPADSGNSRRAPPPAVRLPVRTTPEADAQIREIDSWWSRNRPASPNLFAELAAEFDNCDNVTQSDLQYHTTSDQ